MNMSELEQLELETESLNGYPNPSDNPPKKPRGRPKKEPTSGPASVIGSSGRSSKVKNELAIIKARFDALFFGVGTLVSGLDRFDGSVIQFGGPNVTDALIHTAETDARFREYLLNFCQASGYAELVTAIAGLALPIAARHGLAPGMFVYMAPKEAVEVAEEMRAERERREYEQSKQGQNDRRNGVML